MSVYLKHLSLSEWSTQRRSMHIYSVVSFFIWKMQLCDLSYSKLNLNLNHAAVISPWICFHSCLKVWDTLIYKVWRSKFAEMRKKLLV